MTTISVAVATVGFAGGAEASLRAEQIQEATAGELLIGGPDAIGGIGDWYLANDVVEVIVDDPGRRNATLNHGGTLVDAGLRDRRGEDQFARLFPLANMDQKVFVDYDDIRAEVDEKAGWARLVVSSSRGFSSLSRDAGLLALLNPMVPPPEALEGLTVETEYAVLRGEPFVHITTTLRNGGRRPVPLFAYGDVWMRGGRSMRAFVGNALEPDLSVGFHHLSFDRHNVAAAGDAMVSFTHVVVPGVQQFPPIVYGVFAPERAARNLVNFGVTSEHVNFINAFTFDPDWNALNLWRIAQATQHALAPGATWTYRRRLLIGTHNDVATVTNRIFPLLGFASGASGIEGRVEPGHRPAAIHVHRAESGRPVTQILTRTTGSGAGVFRAVLPPGAYRLVVRAPHLPPQEISVRVSDEGFAKVEIPRLDEPGWLAFDEPFSDGGAGRVIVQGLGDTPDPVFEPELLDFRVDGAIASSSTATRDLWFAAAPGDPKRVAIAPGRYRLTATRGLEYDIASVEVEVAGPGAQVDVPPFAVQRVAELRAFTAADLHVHAEASDDSAVPNTNRLRSMLAEGIQAMVTTDHENLGDFRPALRELAVGDRIRVIQGVEVTSSAPSFAAPWTIGHHNAWPVSYRANQYRNGAPPSQDMSLADLYSLIRRDYGASVVQLNHPRDGMGDDLDEGAFFTHLGVVGRSFDPDQVLTEGGNAALLEPGADGSTRAIDFDAMELMNGDDWDDYRQLRLDWYSLLSQGFRRTGTANSDTHGPDRVAGYPRNYVAVPFDAWDAARFDAAVREGRSFGTNGPLIGIFTANDGNAGDVVAATGGRVAIQLAVVAAPWVPVDEVRLIVNGSTAHAWALDAASGEPLRLLDELELGLERDAYVTVEAGAPLDVGAEAWIASHPGPYTETVLPEFVPTAFSNPIFIDVDGNGKFDAPGLDGATLLAPEATPIWIWVAAAWVALIVVLVRRRQSKEQPI
jgi:hypothetical protein